MVDQQVNIDVKVKSIGLTALHKELGLGTSTLKEHGLSAKKTSSALFELTSKSKKLKEAYTELNARLGPLQQMMKEGVVLSGKSKIAMNNLVEAYKKVTNGSKKYITTQEHARAVTSKARKEYEKEDAIINKKIATLRKEYLARTSQINIVKKHEATIKKFHHLQSMGITLNTRSTAELKKATMAYTMMGGSIKKLNSGNQLQSFLGHITKLRWAFVNMSMGILLVASAFRVFGKPLVDLETEMVTVQKRTKMSSDEINKLEHSIVDLTRSIPESATELAKIAAVAGQLGIRGSDNILEFTRVTAMMANSTVLNSEEAALAIAKIAQAYNIPIEQAENMASVINELSNTTAANSKEISASVLKMASAANILGISMSTTSAIGATLIDMGMRAERAGTRMKTAFTRMSTEATKIKELFDKEKFLTFDIEEMISGDPEKAFSLIIEKLHGIEDKTDRVRLATEIFGRVGATAVLGLVSNYNELQRNIVMASDEFERATSIQREFDIAMATTANQWKLYWQGIFATWEQTASSANRGFGGWLKNINSANLALRISHNLMVEIIDDAEKMGKKGPIDLAPIFKAGFLGKVSGDIFENLSFEEALEDFKKNIGKLGIDSDLTEGQVLQFKIQFFTEKKDFDIVTSALEEFGALSEELSKKPPLKDSVMKEYVKNLLLEQKIISDTVLAMEDRSQALRQYNDIQKELKDLASSEDVQTINEQVDGLKEEFTELSNVEKAVNAYNEELAVTLEHYALGQMSITEYYKEVENLKEKYSDFKDINVPEYLERMKLGNDATKESTNELSNAQKRASLAFSITNKGMSEQLKMLKSDYTDLKDVRFTGEKESLANIHQIELAIKRERLAQLGMTDAIEETNDALKDNKSTYEAWQLTVQEFITSAIRAGNLLGQNVTSAVKKYQTLLLSTSKFASEKATQGALEDEKTALELLEEERTRAQLEYEIGIGEQHFALKEYIEELENENKTVYDSVDVVKNALSKKKDAIDDLKLKQDEMNDLWRDAQDEVKMYELDMASTTFSILDDLDKQKEAVTELINEHIRLAKESGRKSSSGGSSGGWNNSLQDSIDNANSRNDGTTYFADGGIITKPTLAMMGEAGPEMVVPLSGPNAGAGLGQSISIGEISVSGVSGDASDFAYRFAEELRRELRTL